MFDMIMGLVVLAAGGFWLWAVIDCACRDRCDLRRRNRWLALCILAGPIGAIVWTLSARRRLGPLPPVRRQPAVPAQVSPILRDESADRSGVADADGFGDTQLAG